MGFWQIFAVLGCLQPLIWTSIGLQFGWTRLGNLCVCHSAAKLVPVLAYGGVGTDDTIEFSRVGTIRRIAVRDTLTATTQLQ